MPAVAPVPGSGGRKKKNKTKQKSNRQFFILFCFIA